MRLQLDVSATLNVNVTITNKKQPFFIGQLKEIFFRCIEKIFSLSYNFQYV